MRNCAPPPLGFTDTDTGSQLALVQDRLERATNDLVIFDVRQALESTYEDAKHFVADDRTTQVPPPHVVLMCALLWVQCGEYKPHLVMRCCAFCVV